MTNNGQNGNPWQSAAAQTEYHVSAFFYGKLRTGKTQICASFPKPLFLFPRNENSDTTVRGLPVTFRKIGSMEEMRQAVEFLQARAQDGTIRDWCETVCAESLTHYAEIVSLELTNGGRDSMDGRWGKFNQHFTWLRDALFSLPVHRVFTAIDRIKQGKQGAITGQGIAIPGQTAELLGGSCDILAYCERNIQGEYLVHLAPYMGFPAGTRIRGMPNGIYKDFRFDTCIAPYLYGVQAGPHSASQPTV